MAGRYISPVFCLSFFRITGGRTDRRTDGQTKRLSQWRALHYTQLHGKKRFLNYEESSTVYQNSVNTQRKYRCVFFHPTLAFSHFSSLQNVFTLMLPNANQPNFVTCSKASQIWKCASEIRLFFSHETCAARNCEGRLRGWRRWCGSEHHQHL